MIKPGLYRHYKGKLYRVIDFATHSETMEPVALYHEEGHSYQKWVRPISMWGETVEVNGEWVPRFVYVGE